MIKRFFAIALILSISFFDLSASFAANSSSITRLVISKSAVFASSGSAFSTQPDITVSDSSNRAVRDSGNTITASITSGVGGSLVGTTTATTNNSGKASFDNLGQIGRAHV